MWFSFPHVTSLATGLLGGFQNTFNISLPTVTKLEHVQLDAYTPYIEFARAAYCSPNKVTGWECGGLSFL